MVGKLDTLNRIIKAFRVLNKFERTKPGFDQTLSKVKIIADGIGFASVKLKVEDEHANQFGIVLGEMRAEQPEYKSAGPFTAHSTSATFLVNLNMNLDDLDYEKATGLVEEILTQTSKDNFGIRSALLQVHIFNQVTYTCKGAHLNFIKDKGKISIPIPFETFE